MQERGIFDKMESAIEDFVKNRHFGLDVGCQIVKLKTSFFPRNNTFRLGDVIHIPKSPVWLYNEKGHSCFMVEIKRCGCELAGLAYPSYFLLGLMEYDSNNSPTGFYARNKGHLIELAQSVPGSIERRISILYGRTFRVTHQYTKLVRLPKLGITECDNGIIRESDYEIRKCRFLTYDELL